MPKKRTRTQSQLPQSFGDAIEVMKLLAADEDEDEELLTREEPPIRVSFHVDINNPYVIADALANAIANVMGLRQSNRRR